MRVFGDVANDPKEIWCGNSRQNVALRGGFPEMLRLLPDEAIARGGALVGEHCLFMAPLEGTILAISR
jgi:hypothetical protein